jgi:hypothetical protein
MSIRLGNYDSNNGYSPDPQIQYNVPQAPTNLSGIGGCGTISLNWQQPSSMLYIDGYKIYYSNGIYITSVPISQLNLTINNLNYNTEYSFYITSYNVIYQSINSNIYTVTTNVLNTPTLNIISYDITPSPSVNLNLLYGNDGCTSNPYSYNLYGSTTSPINIPSNGQPTPYTLSLNYSTNYTLYVKYLANTNDESTQSNNITIDTNLYPPSNLRATGRESRITVRWNPPDPSVFYTSYTVYRSVNGGNFAFFLTETRTSTSLTNNVSPGRYQYAIEANYNNLTSSRVFSDIVRITS